jgi:hypothetical protein
VQLDVEVALDAEKVIIESFGGTGSTKDKAVATAWENFCRNSFHVFLAAFWERGEDDQVTIEQWDIAGVKWKVIIGNFGIRSFGGLPVTVPPDLFPTIEELIKTLSLPDDCYWVRTFFCNINESETVSEVLVNNSVWETAQDTISKLDWAKEEGYYSVRNFLILQREKIRMTHHE